MRAVIIPLVVAVLGASPATAEPPVTQARIDSLVAVRDSLAGVLDDVDSAIREMRTELVRQAALADSIPPVLLILKEGAHLREEADSSSKTLRRVPAGAQVEVIAFGGYRHWTAIYEGVVGHLIEDCLEPTPDMRRMEEKWWARFQAEQRRGLEDSAEARRADLVSRFGEWAAERILEGKIWLGMTDDMARESWGRHRTSTGVSAVQGLTSSGSTRTTTPICTSMTAF